MGAYFKNWEKIQHLFIYLRERKWTFDQNDSFSKFYSILKQCSFKAPVSVLHARKNYPSQ